MNEIKEILNFIFKLHKQQRMFYKKKNNAWYNQWVWWDNSNNRFFELWILKEKFLNWVINIYNIYTGFTKFNIKIIRSSLSFLHKKILICD